MKVNSGDFVVVSTQADSQVYKVHQVNKRMVDLTYKTNKGWVSGGSIDSSLLKQPSREQLINALKESYRF